MVLAIAAILLGIGVPSFASMIKNQQLSATVNDFFSAISLARSEAIKRGTRVDLVPLDTATGNWRSGWAVLIDKNGNQKLDAGDQLIFQHGPAPDGMTIKSVFTDSSVPYLAYNGTGRSRTNTSSQSPQAGTVSFTLDSHVRRIKVNFLGRARSCNPIGDSTCTGSAESQ